MALRILFVFTRNYRSFPKREMTLAATSASFLSLVFGTYHTLFNCRSLFLIELSANIFLDWTFINLSHLPVSQSLSQAPGLRSELLFRLILPAYVPRGNLCPSSY